MRMTPRIARWAAPLIAATLCLAGTPATAQQIKPLDVEQDGNGVDLLSGQLRPRLPVLSVPAAPSLQFQRLSDLVPYLEGQLIASYNGQATYDINGGGLTSEHFTCDDDQGCRTRRHNGAALDVQPNTGPQDPDGTANWGTFIYTEGGSGRTIVFDQQLGNQAPLTASNRPTFYASSVRNPGGEQLDFIYEKGTASGGWTVRRPVSVISSFGYTLMLTYQGNVSGQVSWSTLAQATIVANGSAVPLAQFTYSGDTVTDLTGRTWVCGGCNTWVGAQPSVSATSLQLPTETTASFVAAPATHQYTFNGQARTHNNWVGSVTVDGVVTNYSYVAQDSAATRISKVTVAGPIGYARTVNIHTGFNVRPRITSIVDSLNRTTSYSYDNDVRLIRVDRPDGSAETVAYDELGNIIERRRIAPGLPDITEIAYYGGRTRFDLCTAPSCFRPIWTRDALGRQTDYTWDSGHGGLLTRLEPADANGQRRKTINGYDAGGRLLIERTCMADGAGASITCGTSAEQVRSFTYWGSTQLPASETLTDGAGTQALTTTYTYDAAGRRLSADGPLPGSDDAIYYRYDAAGRRTWEIGPRGANNLRSATRTTYRDSDDKPLAVETGTVPDPTSTTLTVVRRTDLTYDSRRNAVVEAVSAGGATHGLVQRTFDGRNRLECEARRMNPAAFASLPASACTLGAQGSDGPDRITRNIYDTESRLLQVQRAVGTPIQQNYVTYTYTLSGKQASVTDANGNRAELRYDGHDRQVRWVFPHPTQTGAVNEDDYEAYAYDAAGNRISLRKRDGTTLIYTYDNLNRLLVKTVPTSASGAAGYGVHYGYDLANRQLFARFGSTSGQGVTNVYDIFGRLTSSTTNMGGTSRTISHQYDVGSRRIRVTHPDGGFLTYEYDAGGALTLLREEGGPILASFSYDAAGRLSTRGYAGASTGYGYDLASRPASIAHDIAGSAADQTLGFGYNPASQIVTRTASNDAYATNSAYAVNRNYTVNGLNQYTSAGPATFAYDANGNLTSDGSTNYVYDAENRLVNAAGGSSVVLTYDPLGRLFQTTSPTTGTIHFLYDGDALIGEYAPSGAMIRRYVHGTNAAADDPLISYEYTNGGYRRGLFTDHQGSVIAVTDMYGNPVAINAYDSWGIPNPGNQGRFGYTGQAWIPELGMWHYKARIYSPTLGRFLQTDPIGYDDQINLYAYVSNDPVNRTDPTGMYECTGNRGQCAAVRAAIARATAASRSPRLPEAKRTALREGIQRLGREGQRNGIVIRFAPRDEMRRVSSGAAYTDYDERTRTSTITLPTNYPTLYDSFRSDMASIGRRSSSIDRFSAENERGNMIADESRHAFDQQRLGRDLRFNEWHPPATDVRSAVSQAYGTPSIQEINREGGF